MCPINFSVNSSRPARDIAIHTVHIARIVVCEGAGGRAVVQEFEFSVFGRDALLADEVVAEGVFGWGVLVELGGGRREG